MSETTIEKVILIIIIIIIILFHESAPQIVCAGEWELRRYTCLNNYQNVSHNLRKSKNGNSRNKKHKPSLEIVDSF